MLIKKFTQLILSGSMIAVLTACGGLEVNISPNETLIKPDQQLNITGIEQFSGSKTILIPSNYVQTLVSGEQIASNNGAHSKVNVKVSGMTTELGQELATELYNDLVVRLRKSGWNILTYKDIKSNPTMAKLDVMKFDKDFGFTGFEKDYTGQGDKVWMMSSPKGIPVFDFDFTGNWPPVNEIQAIANTMGANALLPRYVFATPVMYSGNSRGYKKSNASTGLAPRIDLLGGFSYFMFSGGRIAVSENIALAEEVGSIKKISSSSGTDISLFNFNAFRSTAKGSYIMNLDIDKYKKSVLRAGKNLNKAVVEALSVAYQNK